MNISKIKLEFQNLNFKNLITLANDLLKNEQTYFPTFIEQKVSQEIIKNIKSDSLKVLKFYSILFEGLKDLSFLYNSLQNVNKIINYFQENLNLEDEDQITAIVSFLKLISTRLTKDSVILVRQKNISGDDSTLPIFELTYRLLTSTSDKMVNVTCHLTLINLLSLQDEKTLNKYLDNYFYHLILNLNLNLTKFHLENFLEILFVLEDLLNVLKKDRLILIGDSFFENFIKSIWIEYVLKDDENSIDCSVGLYILQHLFNRLQHSFLLHLILQKIFTVVEISTATLTEKRSNSPISNNPISISLNDFLVKFKHPSKNFTMAIAFLYQIVNSKISQTVLKQLDLFPRKFAKSKLLLEDLLGSSESDFNSDSEELPYNGNLVKILISVIIAEKEEFENLDYFTFQLCFQFFIDLCSTGTGLKSKPLLEEHMKLLKVGKKKIEKTLKFKFKNLFNAEDVEGKIADGKIIDEEKYFQFLKNIKVFEYQCLKTKFINSLDFIYEDLKILKLKKKQSNLKKQQSENLFKIDADEEEEEEDFFVHKIFFTTKLFFYCKNCLEVLEKKEKNKELIYFFEKELFDSIEFEVGKTIDLSKREIFPCKIEKQSYYCVLEKNFLIICLPDKFKIGKGIVFKLFSVSNSMIKKVDTEELSLSKKKEIKFKENTSYKKNALFLEKMKNYFPVEEDEQLTLNQNNNKKNEKKIVIKQDETCSIQFQSEEILLKVFNTYCSNLNKFKNELYKKFEILTDM
ncbi:hypothetical protein HDU92_006930 [Lobulomyces angularis]|nr:hypothetical protein HDU92_006930 [Lobulomyces angularis]